MSRKTLTLLAVSLLLGPMLCLGAPLAHAQTVDELLAKHYEACGGLDKMKAVQSMRVTGTMAIAPGMEAPFTMERKRPGKQRMEFQIQGMTGIQAFDGARAWSLMPFQGKTTPEVGSDEDNKHQQDDADFDGALVDWKAKGHTIELAGKETVEGADAFKLKVTKKNGNVEYDYLDAETYLLVKTEGKVHRRGTEIEGVTTFSDFKEVDGLMEPFVMETGAKEMPQKQRLSFSKVELNVPLDDARFAVPAGATGGAPATAATDSAKVAPKSGDTKTAAAVDTTKKDAKKGKDSKSKKKGE
jgi:outer membrane lipoprotein-sorting protein